MTAGHPFFSASRLPPALLCCETENLSISYMCSILSQKDHFVKGLELSPVLVTMLLAYSCTSI